MSKPNPPSEAAMRAAAEIADDFIGETYLRADRIERWTRLIDRAYAEAAPSPAAHQAPTKRCTACVSGNHVACNQLCGCECDCHNVPQPAAPAPGRTTKGGDVNGASANEAAGNVMAGDASAKNTQEPAIPPALREALDADIEKALNGVSERFRELRKLKPNWDSYGAKAIDEGALQFLFCHLEVLAAEDIEAAQIVPLNCGGVQAEWHEGGYDTELSVMVALKDGEKVAQLEDAEALEQERDQAKLMNVGLASRLTAAQGKLIEAEQELAAARQENERLQGELDDSITANKVQDVCQQAWKTPQGFNESPLELIARIIDERDDAGERYERLVAAVRDLLRKREGQEISFKCADEILALLPPIASEGEGNDAA